MPAVVNIGELDTLVTIQECIITSGTQGNKSYSFADFRQVYANVDRRVDERLSIGNLEEGDYITLAIYKIPQLTTRWRVKLEGRSYEITSIDPIDRLSPICNLSLHAID